MHHRFRRRAHRAVTIQLAKQKIVRMRGNVMHRGVKLDHVLIAGQHRGFLRHFLEAAGAVLRIPFVGRGLVLGCAGHGAKSNLHHAHTPRLDARKGVHRPGQLVMQAGLAIRQHLAPEPLNHPAFIGAQDIESTADVEGQGREHQGLAQTLPGGFMGSGKSTVGPLLAERLGWKFIDADDAIAAEAGCTIPEIFTREGEAAFRERERATIARLAGEGALVLGAGRRSYCKAKPRARCFCTRRRRF